MTSFSSFPQNTRFPSMRANLGQIPNMPQILNPAPSIPSGNRPPLIHCLGLVSNAFHVHEKALNLHERGQWPQAEWAYLTAAGQYAFVLGDGHPYVAGVLYNLGDLYHSQKRYDQAEGCYRRALEIERGALGEGHPRTIATMQNLVSLLHDEYRYSEAESLYWQIFQAQQTTLGDRHPDLATTCNDLAVLYQDSGRPAKAVLMYQVATSLYQGAIQQLQQQQSLTRQRLLRLQTRVRYA